MDDAEDVCRLCYKAGVPITIDGKYPDEIDPETNMIRVGQISKQDLTRRGFSLQRTSLYSRRKALAEPARREQLRSEKGKGPAGFVLKGVLLTRVGRVHNIVDGTGAKVFSVYATPNDESEAHAEILFDITVPNSEFLKWRLELRDALGILRPATVLPSEPRSLKQRLGDLCELIGALLFR
ncbi:MAG TPA: hypothetical protein VN612_17140 [Acidobacteriaceae bacterium]|nr:hypothetical protein [Acidobacteriaceae bacterium]